MDLKKLKAFIKLAKDEGVSSLGYEDEGISYSVQFPTAGTPLVGMSPPPTSSLEAKEKDHVNDGLYSITSPFVGTFYASSSPDAPAYVKVGDKIKKGQVLCIVEAMKIMNEIESDIDGEVIDVCLDNESYAEFGAPLFKVLKK